MLPGSKSNPLAGPTSGLPSLLHANKIGKGDNFGFASRFLPALCCFVSSRREQTEPNSFQLNQRLERAAAILAPLTGWRSSLIHVTFGPPAKSLSRSATQGGGRASGLLGTSILRSPATLFPWTNRGEARSGTRVTQALPLLSLSQSQSVVWL